MFLVNVPFSTETPSTTSPGKLSRSLIALNDILPASSLIPGLKIRFDCLGPAVTWVFIPSSIPVNYTKSHLEYSDAFQLNLVMRRDGKNFCSIMDNFPTKDVPRIPQRMAICHAETIHT